MVQLSGKLKIVIIVTVLKIAVSSLFSFSYASFKKSCQFLHYVKKKLGKKLEKFKAEKDEKK